MRRLPSPTLPARPRSSVIVPAAVVGTIALALTGESGAHAAPPAPPLTALPPAPASLGHAAVIQASTAAPATHNVAAGDTVWAIAQRYGLDVAALQAANGLNGDSIIRPGQVLTLGVATPGPVAPAPEAAPEAAPVTYEVSAGDTVSAIASAHGVSIDAVLSANGLTRDSIIYPGEVLRIPSAAAPGPASVDPVLAPGLDAEQSENARLIIRIGRELGVSDRGILIALGTAMQESWLRNLDWGDRDSLGLFQQRPSTGWGTPDQILDRERSTRVFYGGPADPNGSDTRGLLDIPGWQDLSYADAAQAVQISAYPDRYAQWEQPATTWLAVLG